MSVKKQKTVDIGELSTLRMASGNERKYPKVILRGVVKTWVAIGWIGDEKASASDYTRYPVVTENGKVIGEYPPKKKATRAKTQKPVPVKKRLCHLLEIGLSGQDGIEEAVFGTKKALRDYVKREYPEAVARNRHRPSELYWEFDGAHGDPGSGWLRGTEVPFFT